MKKVILISFVAILTIILGLFFYTSNQFKSLNDRYVKLKPGKEERIVLVNVGDGDRKYFAEKILEISACHPKVMGVDLFFNAFSADSEADSLLLVSIEQSKCILGTMHGGMGTHGVHKRFLDAASGYGFAELDEIDGFVTEFQAFYDRVSKRDYHIAYELAKSYDSLAASDFIQSLSGQRSDVVISRLTDQFRIYDYQEAIDCDLVKDRIVILAYLGPTDEDKLQTYARYHDQVDAEGPDMYGAVIVANQVLMILDNQISNFRK